MPWTWRYLPASGQPAAQPTAQPAAQAFPTQSDAESWLGESWRELYDAGVERVTLLEDEREVYTMALSPAT